MKPFATFVCRNSFGEEFEARRATETSTLALIVGDILIAEGRRIRQDQAIKINAAFEARLKEEMKKFRERAEKSIADACIDCRGSGTVTEDGHGCDGDDAKCFKICPVPIQRQCGYCGRWVNAIRALPLFETEEKP